MALVLWKLYKKQDGPAPRPGPVEDLANLKITEARTGDSVSITGAADDLSDLDFTVDRREQFEAGERRWFEVSGVYRERRVRLEVSEGDELEARVILDPKKLTLEELGLTEDDLAAMDERQNTGDNFEFDGKPWNYRFSKEVRASRDGSVEAGGFYGWQFEEEGGKRRILIRKAEGEPFWATISTEVHPGDITVYRR